MMFALSEKVPQALVMVTVRFTLWLGVFVGRLTLIDTALLSVLNCCVAIVSPAAFVQNTLMGL